MHSLQSDGFTIVSNIADGITLQALLSSVQSQPSLAVRSRGAQVYAVRNLLSENEQVRTFARSSCVRSVVEPVLGPGASAVRAIWFDKTPDANWKVAWHQDLSIAVAERVDTPGFGPWSVKAGIVHVQPPPHVLAGMLTLRLHLDDCNTDNGPLKVIPGSHARGVLSPEQIEHWRETHQAIECHVARGGALLMRPLILHASSRANVPAHRRVLHIEFASTDLPNGLRWHERG